MANDLKVIAIEKSPLKQQKECVVEDGKTFLDFIIARITLIRGHE
jgi:hypothetical protein